MEKIRAGMLSQASPRFAQTNLAAWYFHATGFVSDIAIFVLKRDVKLQLTN